MWLKKALKREIGQLQAEVRLLQRENQELIEQLMLIDELNLTPLKYESCRGCAYAVWRLGEWDRVYFLGCRKANACPDFVPETRVIWWPNRAEFVIKEPQQR